MHQRTQIVTRKRAHASEATGVKPGEHMRLDFATWRGHLAAPSSRFPDTAPAPTPLPRPAARPAASASEARRTA